MSEGGDYTPSPDWVGHDFAQARAAYNAQAGRSYARAKEQRIEAHDLVPARVSTQAKRPLLVRVDVSGSMGGWPGPIFSKLPYLEHECKTEYLGQDVEICFGAIGDICDHYPLQIQPFAIGAKMKDALHHLVHEGGGSGSDSYCEAYVYDALYCLRNVDMPEVDDDDADGKPILIYVGDEMPDLRVDPEVARRVSKVDLRERLTTKAIFAELTKKYAVYYVQKPYNAEDLAHDRITGVSLQVHQRWNGLIGADHIKTLPTEDRVVDVIFGILALETRRLDYFREEIEERQKDDPRKIETAYTALNTVYTRNGLIGSEGSDGHGGGSTLHRPLAGKKSKDLL